MWRKENDLEHADYSMNNVSQTLTKNITGLGYQVRYARWNATVFGKLYFLNTSTHKLFDIFLETEHYEKVKASQHHAGYGAAFTYFILPALQAKVSFEQVYRMPEAVELFGDGFIQKSNTDLKPENSKNLNFGLSFDKWVGSHHLLADASYIYRYTKDFIYKGVTLTSDPTTSYQNVGKAITHGVEGSVRYEYANLTNAKLYDNYRLQKPGRAFTVKFRVFLSKM